jgi:hypothetical protein
MMLFAHSWIAGGPQVEMLIFSVALVVLGVIFFVQKSASTWVSAMLIVAGLALAVAAFVIPGEDRVSESPTHHSSRTIEHDAVAMPG